MKLPPCSELGRLRSGAACDSPQVRLWFRLPTGCISCQFTWLCGVVMDLPPDVTEPRWSPGSARRACQQSDVDYEELGLPREMTVWVDPGEVSCRYGEKNEPISVAVLKGQGENQQLSQRINSAVERATSDYYSGTSSDEEGTSSTGVSQPKTIPTVSNPNSIYQAGDFGPPPAQPWAPYPKRKAYQGDGYYPPHKAHKSYRPSSGFSGPRVDRCICLSGQNGCNWRLPWRQRPGQRQEGDPGLHQRRSGGLAFPVRLQVVDEGPGTGPFAQFSNVQSVLITGYIDSSDTSEGIITYSTDLFYRFNCRYPLEYLLENVPLITSSISAAINGNNGSFISTLSLKIYNDSTYTSQLVVPDTGIQLRTKIYVEVGARNLTGNFNVLLDHCFATPSPFGTTTVKHTFFIGCTKDARTTILANGVGQSSRFLFDAFRFREQLNSTVYLHCVTRLCEPSTCQQLLSTCNSGNGRKRRAAEAFGTETQNSVTVSSGPLQVTDRESGVLFLQLIEAGQVVKHVFVAEKAAET
nr:PREDICTED: protein BTG4 [Lepisosteus oculatus]